MSVIDLSCDRTPISGFTAFSRYGVTKTSLGIALHSVRDCGRVSPISAGEHRRITPAGRSVNYVLNPARVPL